MDDLVQFLRDRYDEDGQLARSCTDEVGSARVGDPFEDGSGICERDDFPSYPWGSGERELAYMARFQPERVLADIAAKRRILDWLRGRDDWALDNNLWTWSSDDALRLLALPYADHPAYREEWRP